MYSESNSVCKVVNLDYQALRITLSSLSDDTLEGWRLFVVLFSSHFLTQTKVCFQLQLIHKQILLVHCMFLLMVAL
jgi:hypothetical protein